MSRSSREEPTATPRSGAQMRFDPTHLRDWVVSVFRALGMEESDAAIMGEVIIETELLGVHTHGLYKLPMFVQRIKMGGSAANAPFVIVRDNVSTAVVDASSGLGQVAAYKAMKLAISKAKESGVGFVTVRNSSTYGAARCYTMQATARDCIGIALTNTDPQMAAWGGITKVLGTNPWSIGVPGHSFPILLDFSTTAVSWTSVSRAARQGGNLPEQVGIASDGQLTSDPRKILEGGSILPMAGYKGYGLALVAELLTGVLGGGAISKELGRHADFDKPAGCSHLLGAIDIASFTELQEFRERVQSLVDIIHASELRGDADQIFIPGERSHNRRMEQMNTGILLADDILEGLEKVSRDTGIPLPGPLDPSGYGLVTENA